MPQLRPRALAPHAGALVLTLAFAAICVTFVRQPVLSTFADDSVSYLIMAQVFSPWRGVAPAVEAAFLHEAFHPPLFPLLLAAADAARDVARAHVVTALALAAWLPLAYLLGERWLGNRWAALSATAVIALMPSLWINAKGVLSEPLYGLLLLAALIALETSSGVRPRVALLALLLSCLVLTRTAGLVPAAAYGLWALSRRSQSWSLRLQNVIPALTAALAYAAWLAVRPDALVDQNAYLAAERLGALRGTGAPFSEMAAAVGAQSIAMAQAWSGALMLYWVEGRPLPLVLSAAAGLLALAGLLLRLREGKPDAWMVTGFLATFLVWPFNEQMGRFLFPALPVLVLYAFHAGGALARAAGRAPALAHGLVFLLLASLAAPACVFIYERAKSDLPYTAMTDWYRTPDLPQAAARSALHLGLLEDMAAIAALTRPGERVMWVAPGYIALLAGRHGVRAPAHQLDAPAYRKAALATRADYVFLSRYHPRDTLSERAWEVGTAALRTEGTLLRERSGPGGAASMLLKLP